MVLVQVHGQASEVRAPVRRAPAPHRSGLPCLDPPTSNFQMQHRAPVTASLDLVDLHLAQALFVAQKSSVLPAILWKSLRLGRIFCHHLLGSAPHRRHLSLELLLRSLLRAIENGLCAPCFSKSPRR